MVYRFLITAFCLISSVILLLAPPLFAAQEKSASIAFEKFQNGFPQDPDFFPLGVWLQSPHNAQRYKDLGINLYVGLWQGPTEEQLSALAKAGLYVIADQNDVALNSPHRHIIKGWMQQDEPDNAQAIPGKPGQYNPCITTDELVKRYQSIKAKDKTRPVYMNFGWGVAYKPWIGRGTCTGDWDYYKRAVKAGDIFSFDFYPVTTADPPIFGKLEWTPRGVANLRRWAAPKQRVWNIFETTHIGHLTRRPTPAELRSQVWMSIIHGSTGIIYFVHEWSPSFKEDGIFRYPDIVKAIKALNSEIQSYAPILNSMRDEKKVEISSRIPVASMLKKYGEDYYLFTAVMRNKPTLGRIKIAGLKDASIEVMGEGRKMELKSGVFKDGFVGYGIRIYKITPK